MVWAGIILLLFLAMWRGLRSRAGAPAAGTMAPEFVLPSQDGTAVGLAQFRGQWVVVYFYPKDKTPGCTLEAREFQRDLGEFVRRNVVVLGVSLDSADSHQSFCEKEGLSFRLLSDRGGKVAAAYGSLLNFVFVKIAARRTFLIDPQGKIAKSFLKVSPLGHSREILAELETKGKADR